MVANTEPNPKSNPLGDAHPILAAAILLCDPHINRTASIVTPDKTHHSFSNFLWDSQPRVWRSAMPMDAGEIERLIKSSIPDAQVTIRDLAGDGDHYAATVISASFKGKSRVQQHQLVYSALQGRMGGLLHALALQTGTPD